MKPNPTAPADEDDAPQKRRQTVAQQLSPADLEELLQWAFNEGTMSPKNSKLTINAGPLFEKLKSMGIDCTLETTYLFRNKHLSPGLERLAAARQLAAEVKDYGKEGNDIARGSNAVFQQMVFTAALKMAEDGEDLTNEDVRARLLDLHKIVKDGIKSANESSMTDARVAQLQNELEALKAERDRAKQAVDNLTTKRTTGMTSDARNAIRRELGLSDVPDHNAA